jgi:hypothetical protein
MLSPTIYNFARQVFGPYDLSEINRSMSSMSYENTEMQVKSLPKWRGGNLKQFLEHFLSGTLKEDSPTWKHVTS